MSRDELIQFSQDLEEKRQRRNARRRERKLWLKTAPREETVMRYRSEEKPCSVALYLQAEHFLLGWLPEFPNLQGDAMCVLLTLAHNILHLLHPEEYCRGATIADCPAFSIHEICSAAVEIGLNYRLDPAFNLTFTQIVFAMAGLTQGIDKERLHFNTLLGDLPINL